MNIETMLHEKIQSDFETLKETSPTSDDYAATADELVKLLDRAVEVEKLNIERDKLDDEKKDRIVRNCLTVAGIVIPSIITIWGACKSWEFEKEGTITTIMGRGFMSKLLPKK